MAKKLTRYILIALVLGVIAGWAINSAIDDGTPGKRRAAQVDRRLSEHRHRALPAPDQDDHRALGLFDIGRGDRAHGRRRGARPRRHPLDRLVHPRQPRFADARPDPRHLAPPRRRPELADAARHRGERRRNRRLQSQGFHQPPRPRLDLRGDEHQRDPADRHLLGVLRGRAHRRRRKGQADRPRRRIAGPGDAPGHRLCDAVRAVRGVHRRRQRARRTRARRSSPPSASSSAASISACSSCGRC